jgi:hypothetical protein
MPIDTRILVYVRLMLKAVLLQNYTLVEVASHVSSDVASFWDTLEAPFNYLSM